MTAQTPERLTSEREDFDPGAWHVYGLIRGEPTMENHGWGDRSADGSRAKVYRADPRCTGGVATHNWKGFTEVYHLGRDGRLTLVRFEYDDRRGARHVDEALSGDFYMVLKSSFFGPRLYVPFRDGVLVSDREEWLHEAYVDGSPVAKELCPGCHPEYPAPAKSWQV